MRSLGTTSLSLSMSGRQSHQLHLLKLPRKLLDGRRTICRIIADLPPRSSYEHVRSILEPVVTSIISDNADDRASEASVCGEGVTPIMVACDKSQPACLEFIERKISKFDSPEDIHMMIGVMGHPSDRCLDECGGNSAAHLAASSGFSDGVDSLVELLEILASKNDESLEDIMKNVHDAKDDLATRSQAMRDNTVISIERRDLYLAILSTGNAHNDTPLMIASASGHASFLSHVLRMMYPDGWEKTTHLSETCGKRKSLARVRRAFELKNSSNDTALSLACGHGFSEVVEVLIDSVVDVTYDDLERAKAVVAKTDEALKLVVQKHGRGQMEAYERRGKNVKRCLVMLQVKQAQVAQETMDNLLMEEEQKDTHAEDKAFSRRRKKKKPLNSAVKLTPSPSDITHNPLENSTDLQIGSNGATFSKKDPKLREVIHPDRSQSMDVAQVPIFQSDCDVNEAGKVDTSIRFFTPKIPEEESQSDAVTGAGSGQHDAGDGAKDEGATMSLEAEMESLCLDTSMLLLTPHGMAMKLSPSQLDVVEDVLEQQLAAVQQARRIQSRLLSQK